MEEGGRMIEELRRERKRFLNTYCIIWISQPVFPHFLQTNDNNVRGSIVCRNLAGKRNLADMYKLNMIRKPLQLHQVDRKVQDVNLSTVATASKAHDRAYALREFDNEVDGCYGKRRVLCRGRCCAGKER